VQISVPALAKYRKRGRKRRISVPAWAKYRKIGRKRRIEREREEKEQQDKM
jgi:hypothetical protein